MQLRKTFTEQEKQQNPLAIALGNFDGVHRGHRFLLQQCVEKSKAKGWAPAVLLWDPHPATVVAPQQEWKFILSPAQKERFFAALGIEYLFRLPFDTQVAALAPAEFARRYLVDLFGAQEVFVGFNFSFGRQGSGTPETLQQLGEEMGFAVLVIEPVRIDGQIVSSTLIRQKLLAGDIPAATQLLGYAPILEGMVVPGKGRGSGLGFPTANLAVPPEQLLPAFGVYAAFVEYAGRQYPGVLNIGANPTFNSKQVTVEIHIPGLQKKLYQEYLKISLVQRIRDEIKFASPEALRAQIARDIKRADRILQESPLQDDRQ